MPLFDTGARHDDLGGERALATDELGRRVMVAASHEAIRKGWDAVLNAASNKFDRGVWDKSAAPPVVSITLADLRSDKGL